MSALAGRIPHAPESWRADPPVAPGLVGRIPHAPDPWRADPPVAPGPRRWIQTSRNPAYMRRPRNPACGTRGFTLVELLIAMAIVLVVTGAVLRLVRPAGELVQAQPETADLQQRLRVSIDALQRDLLMAGAGLSVGPAAGPLLAYLPPVFPYRAGDSQADPPLGVFHRPDAISLAYVPPTTAQVAVDTLAPSGANVRVRTHPNCGATARTQLCGFQTGMRVLLFDAAGRFETGSVVSVQGLDVEVGGPGVQGRIDSTDGAALSEVVTPVYWLGVEAATGIPRLMRSNGGGSVLPFVDHVVTLQFEYFGDAAPPAILPGASLTSAVGPWTTYGPRPPPLGHDRPDDAWGAGENCTFTVAGGTHVTRLANLGSGPTPVPLSPAMLTDGPWCPDHAHPNRYDADLLRIRRVRVTVRAEAGPDSLRGPAGPLFHRPGTASSARLLVPDQEIQFDVTLRN